MNARRSLLGADAQQREEAEGAQARACAQAQLGEPVPGVGAALCRGALAPVLAQHAHPRRARRRGRVREHCVPRQLRLQSDGEWRNNVYSKETQDTPIQNYRHQSLKHTKYINRIFEKSCCKFEDYVL